MEPSEVARAPGFSLVARRNNSLTSSGRLLVFAFIFFVSVGIALAFAALGAWIKVRAGSHTLSRQVLPARSYLSQSELPVTIGLGKLTKIDSVEILWPRGSVQKIVPRLDTTTVISEPAKCQ